MGNTAAAAAAVAAPNHSSSGHLFHIVLGLRKTEKPKNHSRFIRHGLDTRTMHFLTIEEAAVVEVAAEEVAVVEVAAVEAAALRRRRRRIS